MLLKTEHVSKAFDGVYALRDVSLELRPGEIHGLVGENGAGKSTLIKLLTGVYRLREGRVLWEGRPVSIRGPQDSLRLGIYAVHQDRTLIPTFDGVENAYLGLDYPTTRLGRVDWAAMRRRVRETADRLGVDLDLGKTAAELSPPQRAELELVRAQMRSCRLLILDEPTAAMTDRESARLFALLRSLREEGVSILYVTHRLDEIFLLTDRVTVLRNGALVDTVPTGQTTREDLIAIMSGNAPPPPLRRRERFGPVLLEARNVASRDGAVRDASLSLRGGEVLGLFGLGGSGRTELLECLFGCRAMAQGSVTLEGRAFRPAPDRAIRRGMVLIPEDRRGRGLLENASVRDNILLSSVDRFARRGVTRRREEIRAAAGQIEALRIKLAGQDQRMLELSGGNQQKAVFARALLTEPRILLCDEPTQAVDAATRMELHRLLREKAAQGAGVLFVSSDLGELLSAADALLVMSRGRTVRLWKNEGLTARQVLSCCYESQEERRNRS